MPQRELIEDALGIWAPSYPRRATMRQRWTGSISETVDALLDAESDGSNEPFVSTYSFPRGHTSDNNIPAIDTLFIDFDFEDGDYSGNGNYAAWRRDLSHLLVRVRRVAQFLQERGRPGWRAALSGHKGVHLFLDFPELDPNQADFSKFTAGLGEYAERLVEMLADETGISDLDSYVDVTSSDLGRLCRVPNTKHGGATESLGEDRYCVAVSIDELAEMGVDMYETLTRSPRRVPWESRTKNGRVGDIISQHIQSASADSSFADSYSASTYNRGRVSEYQSQSNDDIGLDDIRFLTSDRPCVWRFYERDDKYDYGYQSHYAEMFCIRELIEKRVPIAVIKEFLNSAPGYDESYSDKRIKEILARDYNRFRINSMLQNAPEFCGYDGCDLCSRIDDST